MIRREDTIKEYTNIHLENYKNASIEIVKNNTNRLIDEDITSLIKEPPLTSMDEIKNKIISISKEEHMIVENEKLNKFFSDFRKDLIDKIDELKEIRNKHYIDEIKKFYPDKSIDVINFDNLDTEKLNKKIYKKIREYTKSSLKNKLLVKFRSLYKEDSDDKVELIYSKFNKYLKNTYLKQLIENVQIKIMVKDRTLVNMIAEQGERYLFTKENSYIFKRESITEQ